jgi:hypothetical protein
MHRYACSTKRRTGMRAQPSDAHIRLIDEVGQKHGESLKPTPDGEPANVNHTVVLGALFLMWNRLAVLCEPELSRWS